MTEDQTEGTTAQIERLALATVKIEDRIHVDHGGRANYACERDAGGAIRIRSLLAERQNWDAARHRADEIERGRPSRPIGEARFTTAQSLIDWCARFELTAQRSALFADADRASITAIADYHSAKDGPDYQLHRARFVATLTSWAKFWLEDRALTPEEFEDALARSAHLVVSEASGAQLTVLGRDGRPQPAKCIGDLLGMMQEMEISADDKITIKKTSGGYDLSRNESTRIGSLPPAIWLCFALFEGEEAQNVQIGIAVKRAPSGGKSPVVICAWPMVGSEALRQAFDAITSRVAGETKLPLFQGQPEPPQTVPQP